MRYVLDGHFGDYASKCLLARSTGEGAAISGHHSSVSRVEESQSASQRFAKVRCGGSGQVMEKALPSLTSKGR